MIEAECPDCGCIFAIAEGNEAHETMEDRARHEGYLAGLKGDNCEPPINDLKNPVQAGAWRGGWRAGAAVRKQKGE